MTQGTLPPTVIAELKAAAFAEGKKYYDRRDRQFPYASSETKRTWKAMAWDVVFDAYVETVEEHRRKQRIDAYAERMMLLHARRV